MNAERLFNALNGLLEHAYLIEDEGPPGQGWKSEAVQAAIAEAEAAVEEAAGGERKE